MFTTTLSERRLRFDESVCVRKYRDWFENNSPLSDFHIIAWLPSLQETLVQIENLYG